MEQKTAPSWNSIPMFRRSSSSSSSFSFGTLIPSTTTSPLSGSSSPTMCRSSTDLPVPEGPMMTVISPRGMEALTPSSTVWPLKALTTSRHSMTTPLPPLRPLPSPPACPFRGGGGASRAALMASRKRSSSSFMRTSCGYREIGGVAPEEVGQDRVDHGREKQADRHRLGHRAADADRAAGHGVAVIDADADDQEGEHHRLDQRVAEVGQVRVAPEVGVVDAV